MARTWSCSLRNRPCPYDLSESNPVRRTPPLHIILMPRLARLRSKIRRVSHGARTPRADKLNTRTEYSIINPCEQHTHGGDVRMALYVKKLNAQFPTGAEQCDPGKGRPPLAFYLVAYYLHRASQCSSCDACWAGTPFPLLLPWPSRQIMHPTGRTFADWGLFARRCFPSG